MAEKAAISLFIQCSHQREHQETLTRPVSDAYLQEIYPRYRIHINAQNGFRDAKFDIWKG